MQHYPSEGVVDRREGQDLVVVGAAVQPAHAEVGHYPVAGSHLGAQGEGLAPGSPVIDEGISGALTQRLADLDHGSRQVGLGPDIGCYEFNSLFADGFDVGDTGSWSDVVL